MTGHRYPPSATAADLARSAAGLLCSTAPLLFAPANPAIVAGLGGLAGMFLVFGGRALARRRQVVEMTDEALSVSGPLGRSLAWREVERVKLSYYSTRRDRSRGWMQLTVSGGGRTVRLESTLDGFAAVADRAAAAARDNAVPLAPATIANLQALGLDPGPPREARR